MNKKTQEVHEWMKALQDSEKARLAINWKMPSTLFNISCDIHPEGASALQGVDWYEIFKSKDLGKWSHGGMVTPLCFNCGR